MKVRIIYVDGNEASTKQANESLASWLDHGWDAELHKGITPETLDRTQFPYDDMEGGRLQSFKSNEPRKHPIKTACLFNNLQFAKDVLQYNETMVFAEHDTICINGYSGFNVQDFCYLAMDYAFQEPTTLAKYRWKPQPSIGVDDFPHNYPLKYYRETKYKGHYMTPGTAAYMLTPSGAKKVLKAAERNGLEQSDFIYNGSVLRLQYIAPSIVKFNTRNLNLSHTL